MKTRRLADLVPPLAFGLAVLAFWEVNVRLLHLPQIILPPPSAIGVSLYYGLMSGLFIRHFLVTAFQTYRSEATFRNG